MSTDLNCQINSTSSDNTEKIALRIGSKLRGGEIIELTSDLGGGKTVFTKGLARGAGYNQEVTSPTFTISKIYHCPLFDIHHYDFYRLPSAGIVQQELQEVLNDPGVVIVIEWADIIADALPDARLRIQITNNGDDNRAINISCPPSLTYLMDGLNQC